MYNVIYMYTCIFVVVNFDALAPRLGNLVTGFMISDESGNRFFPTAVTAY